jgi:hypothetical protein
MMSEIYHWSIFMSLEKSVEAIIKEAQARGDFDNLKGKGKPIDLSACFETPEDRFSIKFEVDFSVQSGTLSYKGKTVHEIRP